MIYAGKEKSSSSSYSSSEQSDYFKDKDYEENAQYTSIRMRVLGNMKWSLEDEDEDEDE